MSESPGNLTVLLAQVRGGSREAADLLIFLSYSELRRIVNGYNGPKQSQLIELRFFAGLGVEEAAEVLRVSPATIKREWRSAKAWLRANCPL